MPQPGKPSFTKSTDSFARPPSANMGAFPVTSYRSTSNTSTASMNSNGSMRVGTRGNGPRLGGGRPPSATDSRNGVEETEPEMGKRKGTPILSFQPLSGIALRKTRTQQNLRSQTPADKGVRSQHSGSTVRSSSSASSSSSEKSGREWPTTAHFFPHQCICRTFPHTKATQDLRSQVHHQTSPFSFTCEGSQISFEDSQVLMHSFPSSHPIFPSTLPYSIPTQTQKLRDWAKNT
jgi:hypothetical protein